MNFAIQPIIATAVPGLSQPQSPADRNFGDFIAQAIQRVETSRTSADHAAADFLLAGKGDVHSVALASQQAELTMEMFQQVRNKFVQAYQEIMKMPM